MPEPDKEGERKRDQFQEFLYAPFSAYPSFHPMHSRRDSFHPAAHL